MAQADFTKVNVRKSTLARLKALAANLVHQNELNRRADACLNPEPINPRAGEMSLDALLNLLMDEIPRKRKAAKESREKRKARNRKET